ncbi:hypothetical protein [Streptomyces liliifuscus]|uniref:Uncharacterized protein n=1 Tax=Streptomyces liliifuscus TaxID=2797636 RepID=A0A7T7L1Z5_9ACTN|nr:hypothetical protein [Streptomyces liliifuscus]QQM44988.1 hypothetical protein JEQ17_40025 [Streptomyces liliifuscus]
MNAARTIGAGIVLLPLISGLLIGIGRLLLDRGAPRRHTTTQEDTP